MTELKAYESAYILGLTDEIAEEGLISKIKDKFKSKRRISMEEFNTVYVPQLEECRSKCLEVLKECEDKYNRGNVIFTLQNQYDDIHELCAFKNKKVLVWISTLNQIVEHGSTYTMNGDYSMNKKGVNINPFITHITNELNQVCMQYGFKADYGTFNKHNFYIVIDDLYVQA